MKRLSDLPLPDPITLDEYRARIAAKAEKMRRDYPRRARRMDTSRFTCMRCKTEGHWSAGQTFDDGLCIECQWHLFYSPWAVARMREGKQTMTMTITPS